MISRDKLWRLIRVWLPKTPQPVKSLRSFSQSNAMAVSIGILAIVIMAIFIRPLSWRVTSTTYSSSSPSFKPKILTEAFNSSIIEEVEFTLEPNNTLRVVAYVFVSLPFELGEAATGLRNLDFHVVKKRIDKVMLYLTYDITSLSKNQTRLWADSIARKFALMINGTPVLVEEKEHNFLPIIEMSSRRLIFYSYIFENTSREKALDFIFSFKPNLGFSGLIDKSHINEDSEIWYGTYPHGDMYIGIATKIRVNINQTPGSVNMLDLVKIFGKNKTVILNGNVSSSDLYLWIFPPSGVRYKIINFELPFNYSYLSPLKYYRSNKGDHYFMSCTIYPMIDGESIFDSWKIEFEVESSETFQLTVIMIAFVAALVSFLAYFKFRR